MLPDKDATRNRTAILKLSTDKKSRPICDVRNIEVSTDEGSEGWLHIRLSTGTTIHFSPVSAAAIHDALASQNGKGR